MKVIYRNIPTGALFWFDGFLYIKVDNKTAVRLSVTKVIYPDPMAEFEFDIEESIKFSQAYQNSWCVNYYEYLLELGRIPLSNEPVKMAIVKV